MNTPVFWGILLNIELINNAMNSLEKTIVFSTVGVILGGLILFGALGSIPKNPGHQLQIAQCEKMSAAIGQEACK